MPICVVSLSMLYLRVIFKLMQWAAHCRAWNRKTWRRRWKHFTILLFYDVMILSTYMNRWRFWPKISTNNSLTSQEWKKSSPYKSPTNCLLTYHLALYLTFYTRMHGIYWAHTRYTCIQPGININTLQTTKSHTDRRDKIWVHICLEWLRRQTICIRIHLKTLSI